MKEYENILEAKADMEKTLEEIKQQTKKTLVNVLVSGVVAGCASIVFDTLVGRYLPKNVRGITKIGISAASFMIPSYIGDKAGSLADKIMEEE